MTRPLPNSHSGELDLHQEVLQASCQIINYLISIRRGVFGLARMTSRTVFSCSDYNLDVVDRTKGTVYFGCHIIELPDR